MVTGQSQSPGLSDDAPSMPCGGVDAMDQPEAEELIGSSECGRIGELSCILSPK